MAIIINAVIVLMEVASLGVVFSKIKKKAFKYYTMISNFFAGVSSLLFLILGRNSSLAIVCRYTSTCMLILTSIVAIFILIPMGPGVKGILWTDCGLILHLIAPVISFISYVFLEEKISQICVIIPLIVTFIYGIIIIILVVTDKINAPYPFLEVKKQSVPVSIIWIIVILGAVFAISFLPGAFY